MIHSVWLHIDDLIHFKSSWLIFHFIPLIYGSNYLLFLVFSSTVTFQWLIVTGWGWNYWPSPINNIIIQAIIIHQGPLFSDQTILYIIPTSLTYNPCSQCLTHLGQLKCLHELYDITENNMNIEENDMWKTKVLVSSSSMDYFLNATFVKLGS